MIKRLIPLLALLCVTPLHAANCSNNSLGGGWTCVQSAATAVGSGTVSAPTLAYSSNVSAGHLLVVDAGSSNVNTTITPTDTLMSSWSCITATWSGTDAEQTCYAKAASSGADTITFNFGSATSYVVLNILELSGNASSSFFDTSGNNYTSSLTNPSATITTAASDELLVVCNYNDESAPTATAGTDAVGSAGTYTLYPFANGADGGGCEVLANVAGGMHNGTMVWTAGTFTSTITAFKPSGGASVVRHRASVIQ